MYAVFFSFFFLATFVPAAFANRPITIPFTPDSVQHLPNIGVSQVMLQDGTQVSQGEGIEGFRQLVNVILGSVGLLLRSVALFVLFAAGFVLVTAQNSASEQVEKQKMNVLYTVIGLVVFGLSADFIYNYFFINEGSYVVVGEGSEAAAIKVALDFGKRIQELLNLFLSFSGAGAILMLVIAGMRIILTPGNEEEMGHQKKIVMYTAIGIVIIGLANTLVNQIVFPDGGYSSINISALEIQLRGLSNYLLGFLGIILFVVFIISGVVMVANFGNDEVISQAKSAMKNAVIGSFVVFSAYTIVATLIRTFMAG
jgi:hypothetical protein